jgi:hypothetical protein
MAFTLRELHIKVTVNQPQQGKPAPEASAEPGKAEDEKDAVIAQCVDEVINIMNSKNER